MKLIITENQFNQLLNENINDIIVYHGTNHKIDKFTDDFVGGEQAIDANGPGIYFSDTEFDSEHFGNIMYTVRLNSNKFITDKNKKGITPSIAIKLIKLNDNWEINAQDWHENPNVGLNIFLRELFKNNDNGKDILLEIYGDYYRYAPIKFVRNCTLLGIDGIKLTNLWGGGGSSEHYVVYNPNIIEIINIKTNGD